MKTIIKILLAVLVINAAFQAGRAYLANYQFEDDMQQVALFAGARPNANDLVNRVVKEAETRGLPIGQDDVEVRIDRASVTITATYTQDVELIPKTYTRTFVFQPTVSARIFNAQ